MYMNAVDFCVLILLPATFLNSRVGSNRGVVHASFQIFLCIASCSLHIVLFLIGIPW